ncbi:TIGR02453 family protein [Roseobacteraceae bacterium S113]
MLETDAFKTLIPDARAFLADLARNNTRDWFTAHKSTYDTALKAPAKALLDVMSVPVGKLMGGPPRTKLFRPHRDLRFSKDKTPYTTHLHMSWGNEKTGLAFFLGIAPDYVTAGAGWMAFQGAHLAAWREGVGAPEGAQLHAAIQNAKARLGAPELKRVPAPYDADHPRAELLRRKSLVLWDDTIADADIPLTECLSATFTKYAKALAPVQALLPEGAG